jgi:hypothetical protein
MKIHYCDMEGHGASTSVTRIPRVPQELHSTLGPGGKGTIEMLSLSQAGSKPMTAIGGTSKPTPAIDTGLTHILR